MSNNTGFIPLDVASVSKETDTNAIAERLDGKLTDYHVVTVDDSGADVLITSTNWRTHGAFVFTPDGTNPPGPSDGFELLTTNLGVGFVMIINTLACSITFGSYEIAAAQQNSFFWNGSTLYRAGPAFEAQVFKRSVRAFTDANITITTALNPGDVLQGLTLSAGERIGVGGQTDMSENGIWIVGSPPVRATDADALGDFVQGVGFFVEEADFAGDMARLITPGVPDIGTDDLEFEIFSGGVGGGGASDFTDLGDVPANYTSAGLKFVRVNTGATGLEFVTPTTFLLGNMPANLTGASLKALRVNAGETAYEHVALVSTLLGDMPANFTSAAKKLLRVNSAGNAYEQVDAKVRLSYNFGGAPGASVAIFTWVSDDAYSFAASLAGSVVKALTAATAQTDFDIRKNNSSVGTIRFAASGTVATYVGISAFTVASGDYIQIISPLSPDATLANIMITLRGLRDD